MITKRGTVMEFGGAIGFQILSSAACRSPFSVRLARRLRTARYFGRSWEAVTRTRANFQKIFWQSSMRPLTVRVIGQLLAKSCRGGALGPRPGTVIRR